MLLHPITPRPPSSYARRRMAGHNHLHSALRHGARGDAHARRPPPPHPPTACTPPPLRRPQTPSPPLRLRAPSTTTTTSWPRSRGTATATRRSACSAACVSLPPPTRPPPSPTPPPCPRSPRPSAPPTPCPSLMTSSPTASAPTGPSSPSSSTSTPPTSTPHPLPRSRALCPYVMSRLGLPPTPSTTLISSSLSPAPAAWSTPSSCSTKCVPSITHSHHIHTRRSSRHSAMMSTSKGRRRHQLHALLRLPP
ncbi:hypothetical protein GQ55_4G308500 [Panicum hallii var. hallii]|uniref:Uncharacterized protein n=1 Tax=Panicum hallii var. hallii TaxID=1504633 RepID=A0A2T7E1Y5_9POAL|nr:hypothetical protein GQ55_4G308500 [Panicum hallii var. hallii]